MNTNHGICWSTEFERGLFYCQAGRSAFEVHGDIALKYLSVNGPDSDLGFPISDVEFTADRRGRVSHFQGGHGYWRPGFGAFIVKGAIFDKYNGLGGVQSDLGYPSNDEHPTSPLRHGMTGWFNHFEGGSVFCLAGQPARTMFRLFTSKWSQFKWEQGIFGFPLSDEKDCNKEGYRWLEIGSMTGSLGYPVTDEVPTGIRDTRTLNTGSSTGPHARARPWYTHYGPFPQPSSSGRSAVAFSRPHDP